MSIILVFIVSFEANTVTASPPPLASDSMIKPLFPLFASLTLGVVSNGVSAQASPAPLSLQVYNADAGSFHVNAVLVSGKTDAVLIDTGFTRADALRIAAMVLDSRKTLKTIYISQADPDFYFGAGVLKSLFPSATLIASAPTVKKIQATLPAKLSVWGPRLGVNAPADVPLPEVMTGSTIQLEGETLEIRGLDDSLPHRSYVWIPSLKAIVGGVNVFAGLHVWTADTQTAQERAAGSVSSMRSQRCNRALSCPATCLQGRSRTFRRSPTRGPISSASNQSSRTRRARRR